MRMKARARFLAAVTLSHHLADVVDHSLPPEIASKTRQQLCDPSMPKQDMPLLYCLYPCRHRRHQQPVASLENVQLISLPLQPLGGLLYSLWFLRVRRLLIVSQVIQQDLIICEVAQILLGYLHRADRAVPVASWFTLHRDTFKVICIAASVTQNSAS